MTVRLNSSLLNYENFKPIHIRDVMTSELQSLRQQRTRAEFCWTLTPFLPTIVFERDATADRATYLDADLWFLKSPAPIFNELEAANKGVLITSHNYSAEYDQSSRSGKFCVQFLTFYREEGNQSVNIGSGNVQNGVLPGLKKVSLVIRST